MFTVINGFLMLLDTIPATQTAAVRYECVENTSFIAN